MCLFKGYKKGTSGLKISALKNLYQSLECVNSVGRAGQKFPSFWTRVGRGQRKWKLFNTKNWRNGKWFRSRHDFQLLFWISDFTQTSTMHGLGRFVRTTYQSKGIVLHYKLYTIKYSNKDFILLHVFKITPSLILTVKTLLKKK